MNDPAIILGTATGGGAIMIGGLLLVIVLFLTVRWLMQKRAG